MGKKGGSEYRSYGGHRLWIAPEDEERTTQPDNDPVEYEEEGGFHLFRSKIEDYRSPAAAKAAGEGVGWRGYGRQNGLRASLRTSSASRPMSRSR